MPENAVVVGAGFGGIAAALRLKAKGYDVHIIDQCKMLGGRAQVFHKDGFCFDAGPTVITAPHLFEELFKLFGKNLNNYVTLKPLDLWYRFVFSDGDSFDYGGSLDATLNEIRKHSEADAENYLSLLEESRRIFEVGFEQLAAKPFGNFLSMVQTVPDLIRLKSFQSVWSFVCRHLENNKLRQAFSIQPLLVGGNPFDTTSIYSLIHYLERKWGIHYAMGGTGALVEAFGKLMREEGIKISLEESVQKIQIQDGCVKAVQLESGEVMPTKLVISNADPSYLYERMIDQNNQPITLKLKRKAAKHSMGLFVYYFGTTKHFKKIAHHTIVLGESYKALLDDIFKKKILNDDFSMYLHRPTATDASMAPKGCDTFYVLVPVPNLEASIDWSREGERLKLKIIDKLSERLMPNLKKHIKTDFYKSPEDFKRDYSSFKGTGFSIAPILRQSAWFRYHNQAEGIKGLYLTGAGTHPGAGLPGVISSAKVIDELIPKAA